MAGLLGGVRNSTSANSLARFAVDRHNKKESVEDDRPVDDLLSFINGENGDSKEVKAPKNKKKKSRRKDQQKNAPPVCTVSDTSSSPNNAIKESNGVSSVGHDDQLQDSEDERDPEIKEQIDRQVTMAGLLGGVGNSTSANSNEIDDLARFAVDQHNQIENKMLKLARVVKAQEQVVAGTMHHLTLEVDDAGGNKIYLAKIWVKPWENFKQLQEFNHIPHPDHDVQKDGEGSGYQSVPVHDPVVQDAANHLLKTLQQRSNSLYPYELQEVVHAKAETLEGSAKYDILVKLKRNDKEEKYKANVHKDNDGNFHVNNMVQDHS